MNKTKRLLALVICLLMTITSLPVFADGETGTEANNGIVALDLKDFTSTSDMNWLFTNKTADFWGTSVEDGAYKVEQVKSDVVNSSYPDGKHTFESFVVDSNTDARTVTVANAISGKMKIELDVEALMLQNPDTTNTTSANKLADSDLSNYVTGSVTAVTDKDGNKVAAEDLKNYFNLFRFFK